MARRNRYGVLAPVVLLFIIVNALAIGLRTRWMAWSVDQDVLIIGNLVLFLLTLASFFIARRGLYKSNQHAFNRAVMTGIMVKMFLAIVVAFAYIATYKKDLNKPALFICMGLYLLYTFLEVSALTRSLRTKPDA